MSQSPTAGVSIAEPIAHTRMHAVGKTGQFGSGADSDFGSYAKGITAREPGHSGQMAPKLLVIGVVQQGPRITRQLAA